MTHLYGYGPPIETCPGRPTACPICGAEISGGGTHTLYFRCGGKCWTIWHIYDEATKTGQPGLRARCGIEVEDKE